MNIRSVNYPIKIKLREKVDQRKGKENFLFKKNMVFVHGGIYMMGDKDGEPDEQLHRVKVNDFYISKYDNVNTLKNKTQKLEYKIFPEAIIKIYRNI